MIDLLNEIWQTMRTNKLRTILTGIAVTWGVFMLIVLLSMARGVTNMYEYDMMADNEARISVYNGNTSMPYKGKPEGRYIQLEEHDMGAIKDNDRQHVAEVTARLWGGGTISSNKAKISSQYTGVFPVPISQINMRATITQGRFINERDMKDKAKVMVISQYHAEQLFPPSGKDAYGNRVECQGLSFKIVGIYDSKWSRDIYIPYSTARMLVADKNDLGTLSVELKDVATEDDGLMAENNIRSTLARTHDFNPNDPNAIWINNSFISSIKSRLALIFLNTGTWILGILTLLTGMVGISNIMFVTVKERTHEIGIRRAIGARPSKILTQVIAEAVAITLVFGYLGIVLGMIVTQIIAYFVEETGVLRNPTVSISIALEVTAFLTLAGALAGLFPALRALKIKPVEALRDE
ncbi:MAG: FtsX-like permease family protein [Bacteroides sp.]|nr:FtsX-like permease family protein [Bacteroides sp.]MBD5357546.1 FtsX-like permease family protein [Bacteroides sp.]